MFVAFLCLRLHVSCFILKGLVFPCSVCLVLFPLWRHASFVSAVFLLPSFPSCVSSVSGRLFSECFVTTVHAQDYSPATCFMSPSTVYRVCLVFPVQVSCFALCFCFLIFSPIKWLALRYSSSAVLPCLLLGLLHKHTDQTKTLQTSRIQII